MLLRPVLLSLGSINADFQMRVAAPPGSGETLLARDLSRLSGGKAANRAFLARRLGLEAALLGRVGDDELQHQALGPLRATGMDLTGVTVAAGRMTAVSVIAVPPDGKKTMLLAANANDDWDEGAVRAIVARVSAAPAGSLLAADFEIPADAVRAAAQAALARNMPVVLDPSWPDRVPGDLLGRALAVAPNVEEAEALTGVTVHDAASAAAACRSLAGRGVTLPFVKLEDGGCVFLAEGRAIAVTPPPVEVVDTTGGGDAFTGALAVALMEGRPVRDAALFAVAAATIAVTGWGSQPAYPDHRAIEALLPHLAETCRDVPF